MSIRQKQENNMAMSWSSRDAYTLFLEGLRYQPVSFMCSSRGSPYLEFIHYAGRGDRKVTVQTPKRKEGDRNTVLF